MKTKDEKETETVKKHEINRMKLEFDAISRNEAFARQALSVFAASLDPTVEEISDLRVVISEAVTNCVVHAYRSKGGRAVISASLYDDRSMRVKVRDFGCGIEDIEQCMQPLYTTDPSGERGGMGFPIMRAMSEKFRVTSRPGKGTTLYIEFKFD